MKKRILVAALLDRLAPPEGLLLLVLAVLIGSATGFAAVFLSGSLNMSSMGHTQLFFPCFPDTESWHLSLFPLSAP
jgi:hypothetical protein